jgi:hypothetical protein
MWWSPPPIRIRAERIRLLTRGEVMEQAHRAPAAHSIGVAPTPLTFEELFAAEHESLFRALYLITGSTQESEELMQDAFLKVFERWDRVQMMENPGGYLCRVAINGARSRQMSRSTDTKGG